MGAGKTSVGQALAARLGWRFVDLDRRIEQQEGRAIAEIFREFGEAAFRRAETRALQQLLSEIPQLGGAVAALGGGAFAQQENADLLRRFGCPIIFLDAPVEELRARCAGEGALRPLFSDENQFRQLYEIRRAAYMKADFRVDTSGKPVAKVAEEVVAILERDGRNHAH